MGIIKIGTCGYSRYQPGGNWKDRFQSKLQAYSDAFEVVEINRTFYKLPMFNNDNMFANAQTLREILGERK
ncbi:MAG: hypothetical protein K9L59_17870 [Desulfobacterales bacterium]|nr:hypothetical protein [Desulfobacterales bacterium]